MYVCFDAGSEPLIYANEALMEKALYVLVQ